MTEEEFDNKMKIANHNHKNNINAIGREYANNKNLYEKGDIAENNHTKILVDSIGFYYPFDQRYPLPLYSGIKLKKDNKPFKNGERERIYQSDEAGK